MGEINDNMISVVGGYAIDTGTLIYDLDVPIHYLVYE